MRRVLLVNQHRQLLGVEPESNPIHVVVADVAVDRHESGHRLLLEPLPGVSGIDSGVVGEFGYGAGAPQRLIKTKSSAQMDRLQFQGPDRGRDQTIFEGWLR
jgi:hypothetical protein